MLLIKNADVYSPKKLGKKDVLICGGKIEHIADHIENPSLPYSIIDGSDKLLIPGLIDQHVHITGGGGEGGFSTRTPEIQLSELIKAGVTTVVGLLGTDGSTRSVENLYAKTMALNEEGVTAYMMTGAYKFDGPSITGDVEKDIIFCEKILGAKLALSDHRSSNIGWEELVELGSKTRVAGMLRGKPGMVVLHMGNGKENLKPVFDAIEKSDIPVTIFRPTHMGRNKRLRKDAQQFLKMGGYVDYSCGARKVGGPAERILEIIQENISTDHITISSDGHGSWSKYDNNGALLEIGVAEVNIMMRELRHMVLEKSFKLEAALPFFTSNVAEALNLKGKKGEIVQNADADILLLDREFNLDTVVANGEIMMRSGELLRKGMFE